MAADYLWGDPMTTTSCNWLCVVLQVVALAVIVDDVDD